MKTKIVGVLASFALLATSQASATTVYQISPTIDETFGYRCTSIQTCGANLSPIYSVQPGDIVDSVP